MWTLKKCQSFLCVLLLLFVSFSVCAQTKVLRGVIQDEQSGEPVPFASMQMIKSGHGILSDSAGGFTLRFDQWPNDSVQITYVGYQPYILHVNDSLLRHAVNDTIFVYISMARARYASEVVVSRKVDFGLLLWRKIKKHKEQNDRYRFHNFSYELYNKLELDLNNVNRERLETVKLLKPFAFVLNNIDSSEEHP
ncbi:MAG TPA: carboxypeptidase-like regulatory domain-containing protein, partial [Puia sp.]|nr:carboxypeptidase-like regulatory domain-containing protein [Puia sp.]